MIPTIVCRMARPRRKGWLTHDVVVRSVALQNDVTSLTHVMHVCARWRSVKSQRANIELCLYPRLLAHGGLHVDITDHMFSLYFDNCTFMNNKQRSKLAVLATYDLLLLLETSKVYSGFLNDDVLLLNVWFSQLQVRMANALSGISKECIYQQSVFYLVPVIHSFSCIYHK